MNLAFYVSSTATRVNKILNDDNRDLLNDVKVVFSDDKKNVYLKEKLDILNTKYLLFDYNSLEVEKRQKKFRAI